MGDSGKLGSIKEEAFGVSLPTILLTSVLSGDCLNLFFGLDLSSVLGLFGSLVELYGTLWNFMKLYGTFWNFKELYGTFCNFKELYGTFWNFTDFQGTSWYFLELF